MVISFPGYIACC